MSGYLVVVGAATVFVATNIDNLLVLLAFFADDAYTDAEIFVGQYVGIGLLVALSLLGSRAAALLPHPTVGLLGLVPLGVGLRRLMAGTGAAVEPTDRRSRAAHTLVVAAAAIANGGDNVAAYIPFFALLTGVELMSSLAVFAILTALWCITARAVVTHPASGPVVRRYGRWLVGAVMIALGLTILARSGTLGLWLG
jgi:cadmium resistance protein CadD (predicted permease)